MQHRLEQHFLLAGVHRTVGVDDGAQPIASPAHALEFGHHPALLFQNKLDGTFEHERPIVGAVVFHGQIPRLERQRRRVRLGGVAPALLGAQGAVGTVEQAHNGNMGREMVARAMKEQQVQQVGERGIAHREHTRCAHEEQSRQRHNKAMVAALALEGAGVPIDERAEQLESLDSSGNVLGNRLDAGHQPGVEHLNESGGDRLIAVLLY